MRAFEYFLFENFDPDKEAAHPGNPRSILGKNTDAILSELAQSPAQTCSYQIFCDKYGAQLVDRLIDCGVLRRSGTALAFDCPIFLREDAGELHGKTAAKASALVDLLDGGMAGMRACCAKLKNGFSVEQNLYHILCGMVFDGRLFDYLQANGALATGRPHPSGLDYLTVIYEKCEELRSLSDGLLCSYNRLFNKKCALQSFGDAQGPRYDFYRFFRLLEQGRLPGNFSQAKALLDAFGGANKDALLDEVVTLVQTGRCAPAAMALLESFGYARDGALCVPVYTTGDQACINELAAMVEDCLGQAISGALIELAGSLDSTAVRHGVNRLEIANELYHILFGSINEELVSKAMVAAPRDIPGEGRYFKCVKVSV